MLKIEKLTAGYNGKIAVKDVSFSLNTGSFVSVIGVNGSGKTTLLKAVSNIIKKSNGSVFIDKINADDLKRKDLVKKICYLAQNRNIPDMTVEQLVLHGRFPYIGFPGIYSKSDIKISKDCIDKMGISEFSSRSLSTLSGGQLQKAYIAMAIAQDSEYILLDEPTNFLDITYQLSLMSNLKKLAAEGKGILAVMHDLPLAFNYSDYILVMNNGEMVAFDTVDAIMQSGIIKEIFNIEIKKNSDGIYYSSFEK